MYISKRREVRGGGGGERTCRTPLPTGLLGEETKWSKVPYLRKQPDGQNVIRGPPATSGVRGVDPSATHAHTFPREHTCTVLYENQLVMNYSQSFSTFKKKHPQVAY